MRYDGTAESGKVYSRGVIVRRTDPMSPQLSPALFNLKRRSLTRGNILVLSSLLGAVLLSDFPHNRATLLLVLPTLVAMVGTAETIRCMRRRWDFYHAGVMLCIYMDLMAFAVIVFMLLYPYGHFLSSSR
jgi:hypothetical protein